MVMLDEYDAPVRTGQIRVHGPEGFAAMRKAGRLVAECLDMITPHVVPGALTEDLDRLIYEFTLDHGGAPACLGYRGYAKTVCTSINHVVCHGVPGPKALRDGDIVNIDHSVVVDGWHGDSSRMFGVGELKPQAKRLIDATYEALDWGLAVVRPGKTFGDIGHAIQTHVESQRMSVVRDFCGHGIGRLFHDAPNVLHFGRPGTGEALREGMIFTVEPMVNLGKAATKVLGDGWTAVDAGQVAFGAVRTHGRRHRQRDGSLHPFAQGRLQAALPKLNREARVAAADDDPDLFTAPTRSASPHAGHRERLRERALNGGLEALPDYELLEMLLFRALPRKDTKAIAKALIARFGSLAGVFSASADQLQTVQYVGEAAALDIKLAYEAAQRFSRSAIDRKRPIISSWTALLAYVRTALQHEGREQFRVLFLDSKNQLIVDETLNFGTVDHAPVYPREVVRPGPGAVGCRGDPGAQSPFGRPEPLWRRHRGHPSDGGGREGDEDRRPRPPDRRQARRHQPEGKGPDVSGQAAASHALKSGSPSAVST